MGDRVVQLDLPSGTAETTPATRPTLTSLDLVALGAVVTVALLAWASFALAHLGRHSLWAALLLTAVALAVLVASVRRGAPFAVRADAAGAALGLACAAASLFLTLPGFGYGVADKDPGVYVSHAIAIAHTGDVTLHDPLLARTGQDRSFPVRLLGPGARLPGVWVHDAASGEIRPQFYHLWPALLATTYDAGGLSGLRATTPLVGAVSVLVLVALLRRVAGLLVAPRAALVAAGAGGLMLATNMLQVWQARYPSTETLSQALYVGALLGLVLAFRERWWPAAAAAGLLVGIGWLNRPDGVLLVVLAVALGAVVLATGRWDPRAWAFSVGLAVVLPHALWQAYSYAKGYSLGTGVPPLRTMAALTAVALVGGLLLRFPLRAVAGAVEGLVLDRRAQRALGVVVVGGVVALIGLGFLRPRLFGADMFDYNGRLIRSYDEQNLRRLSWFLTLPAFAVLPVGVAAVALRRWSATLWAVVLPTLLLAPVYVYAARNSSRLMWWTRRYTPTVLPGFVVLLALALALALVVRYRGRHLLRVPAAVAVAALLAVFLHQSVPVRRHDEFGGSFEMTAQLAAIAGREHGIFLWEPDGSCCEGATHLFPTALWLQHDQLSALLAPDDPASGQTPMGMITAYRAAFPDRPLFVVTGRGALPAGVDPGAVTQVADLRRTLRVWDESDVARPAGAHDVDVRVTVWKVTRG